LLLVERTKTKRVSRQRKKYQDPFEDFKFTNPKANGSRTWEEPKGSDVKLDIQLDLHEALGGTEKGKVENNFRHFLSPQNNLTKLPKWQCEN
jgi:DnaJ-class molecular chaperone